MNIFQALVLGVIQGITEFLPVSSSAHLVIAPYLFGWSIPENQIFPFDVLVQIGTLIAAVIYFRRDWWEIITALIRGVLRGKPFAEQQSRLGWLILLASIPAAVFGILAKDLVEQAFSSPSATAFFLFGTALILLLAEKFGRQNRDLPIITWKDALWIGAAQALSVYPGISRSGATIAGGMGRNFERRAAARFSFLMMVPVMLGAGFISMLDLLALPDLASFLPLMVAGVISSALIGYLAIHWLLSFLGKRPLYIFSAYCTALAVVTLLVIYV